MLQLQEVTQFVLDVGKLMHPHLELASRAVMDFVESKVCQAELLSQQGKCVSL